MAGTLDSKFNSITKKYSKKVSPQEYKLVLKSSYDYVLRTYPRRPEEFYLNFLMGTFIDFKKKGVTDTEWSCLNHYVKNFMKGKIIE